MTKSGSGKGRSSLSDITPDLGPGPIRSKQELDSLERCKNTIKSLFESPGTRLARIYANNFQAHLNDITLDELVSWYWYNEKKDRRTKASDLKRELKTIITHLEYVVEGMKSVPQETRQAIDLMLIPLGEKQTERAKVFDEAERLNNLLYDNLHGLVEPVFTRQPANCISTAGETLASIWGNISQEPFKRNKKLCEATKIVTDNFEFGSEGIHFVHVMLQAIDPSITFSKVQSAMVRAAARARETKDLKSKQ